MFKKLKNCIGLILILTTVNNSIAAEKDKNKLDKENKNPRNQVIVLFKSNGYTPLQSNRDNRVETIGDRPRLNKL